MHRYRKVSYIIIFCFVIFFAGYISISFFYKFILNYVESKLLPETAKEIGIDNLRFKIQNAGLFGADIAYISAGRNNINSPSVDSVHIEYDPVGLYNKYIKKVVISGIRIECEFNNRKFNIRGFDWDHFVKTLQSKKNTSSESIKSFPVGSIELRNSNVAAYWKNQKIDIPINLIILAHDKNKSLIDCLLNLYPRNTHINIASRIDLNTNKAEILFGIKRLSFERFSDFSSLIPDISISGSADIDGKLKIMFSPFIISSVSCTASAYNFSVFYNNINLTNSTDEVSGKKIPAKFDIRNKGDNKWIFSATSFLVNSPLPVNISGLKCNIVKSEELFDYNGEFYTLAGEKNFLRIKTNYYLNLTKKGKWNFKASGASVNSGNIKSGISIKGFDILSKNLKFNLSGKGYDKKSYLKYFVTISGSNAFNKNISLKSSKVLLNGSADIFKSAARGNFNINSYNTALSAGSLQTDIPAFSISGNFNKNLKSVFQCDGKIQFNDVKIKDPQLQVAISGIKGTIPFKWPLSCIKSKGSVVAEQILWKNINIGTLSGSIGQSDSGLLYKGRYKSIPFQGMNLDFIGKTDLLASNGYETGISFDMKKFKLSSEMDFYRFFPQAIGMSFGCNAELNGKVSFKENKIKGFVKANIEKGSFNYKEKMINVEGIKASIAFPNLPALVSAPEQKFAFDRASIGSILLTDGAADFQIEADNTLFVEKSRFKWCRGTVFTTALRVSVPNKDLNLMLFCDRLNLAELIEQFGVAKAEGDGTVSGKIPVEFRGGKLIFADGFLYSAPGEGGTIHLAEAKIMSENLIPGTSQFAQIELTLEALKNYIYDWAKLKFSTDDENLLLNLQFDGKPADVLPFKYDKKTGGFMRVKSAQEGSHFQGIRLDINLTVPLNKILYYKDVINIDKSLKKSKSKGG